MNNNGRKCFRRRKKSTLTNATKNRSIKMKTEQLTTCKLLVTSARTFRSGREKRRLKNNCEVRKRKKKQDDKRTKKKGQQRLGRKET